MGPRGLPPPGVLPAAGSCHLWPFPVSDGPDGPVSDGPVSDGGPAHLLSRVERERMAALGPTPARVTYLTSRVAQRLVLGHYLDRAADRIRIRRECTDCGDADHGRPCVDGGPDFSVSHSGKWVLIAVAGSGRIGVDVERVPPGDNHTRLAERALTPGERRMFDALPPPARRPWLYQVWTRKEAIGKATGRGITAGFSTLDTRAPTAATDGWLVYLRDLAAPAGYVAALACTERVGPVRVCRLR